MQIHRRDFLRLSLAGGAAATLTGLAVSAGAPAQASTAQVLNIGHLPNLTHAHALVARALERAGTPFLAPRLGPEIVINWNVFPTGTAAAEAMFSGAVDITYAGPNPILNGYIRSAGEEMRVLTGAVRGGAALVVPKRSTMAVPADFRGKRIGTPALGNTQDVAARAWLKAGGVATSPTGGEALVVPTSASDQLALFATGDLDAVWTTEPTVTRLLQDGGGRILVEEADAITTLAAATRQFTTAQPALAGRFVTANAELTAWIASHPAAAKALVRSELKEIMGRTLKPAVIDEAWQRLDFNTRLHLRDLQPLADSAYATGLLPRTYDLSRLFEGVTS